MNLKLEALKAIIFFALGGFIFVNYWPKPQPPIAPESKQSCVANLKKHTNPDGSTDESFDFIAIQGQHSPEAPKANFVSGGAYIDNKFHAGLSAELKLNTWAFEAESDLKQDHRISVKKILLEW